jgi:hypothetical protein
MRRRDFTIGLLLAAAVPSALAQEPAKHHRIAIIIPAGPITSISDAGARPWQAFFEELLRLGDSEGQNLTIERYSGEGRPEGYADLAREVVNRKPEVIVATNDATAKTVRATAGTIPIVWIGGDPAHPHPESNPERTQAGAGARALAAPEALRTAAFHPRSPAPRVTALPKFSAGVGFISARPSDFISFGSGCV